MQTRMYREQHGRIRQTLRELLAADGEGAREREIRTILGRLTGLVNVHLSSEDERLYPRLLAHEDQAVRTSAKAFQESMGGLAAAYTGFVKQWTSGSAIEDDRAGFFEALRGVAKALGERMDREDRELYAMADRELREEAS